MTKNYLISNLFSLKLPLRIFALNCISLLGFITGVVTYKTTVEIFYFFKLTSILQSNYTLFFNISTSVLVALATIVQSSLIIWDRMSYWGQLIDNCIIYCVFNKKYFLDEAEELLKNYRKLINQANNILQDVILSVTIEKKINNRLLMDKLDQISILYLSKAGDVQQKIIKLLKNNEVYDNISISRKNEVDLSLNTLIMQLAETCIWLTDLKNKLQK